MDKCIKPINSCIFSFLLLLLILMLMLMLIHLWKYGWQLRSIWPSQRGAQLQLNILTHFMRIWLDKKCLFSVYLLSKRSKLCTNTYDYCTTRCRHTQSVWDRRSNAREAQQQHQQRIDNDKILKELRPMFIRFDLIGLKRLNHWHITWSSVCAVRAYKQPQWQSYTINIYARTHACVHIGRDRERHAHDMWLHQLIWVMISKPFLIAQSLLHTHRHTHASTFHVQQKCSRLAG